MSIRKRLPSEIKFLNFTDLSNSQMWVLADWMGCRRPVSNAIGQREGKLAVLKQFCEQDVVRAQEGYDIIVRGIQPKPSVSGAVNAEEVEKRLYSTLLDVVNTNKAGLEGELSASLKSMVDAAGKSVSAEMRKAAKDALAEAAKSSIPLVIKMAGKTKSVKGPLPDEFKRMVQLGAARKNIMLVGPAGCGKTYLAAKLAEALDLDFADQSCSAGISESQFTGWLLPVGKNGTFEYVSAPFIEIYEKGGVFLFDEMDAADANLLTFLNKALANESFHLPQRIGNTLVKRHKDFVAIGAANTFGHGADAMYVGRNQLDAATLDRFRVGMINMDYCIAVEESMAPEVVLSWAWAIRAAIRKQGLRRIMSTRTIKDLADMVVAADWTLDDCAKSYFADWTQEEVNAVAREIVAS